MCYVLCSYGLFVCVCVTDICGGYLSFVVSIFCIGVVTAIIGDVASHFGCTLGIKDSVTAIVFVALGTSIPGKLLIKESVRIYPRKALRCLIIKTGSTSDEERKSSFVCSREWVCVYQANVTCSVCTIIVYYQ